MFLGTSIADINQYRNGQPKLAFKAFELIQDIQKTPFEGLGKPEPLKGDKQGMWSRRVNEEHRLIYEVTDTAIRIFACRTHYGDK